VATPSHDCFVRQTSSRGARPSFICVMPACRASMVVQFGCLFHLCSWLALALQYPFDLPCSGCGELDMPVLLCLLDGVSHALVPLRDHTHVCALDHLQDGCTTNMGTGCFVLVYMFGALMVTLVSTFFPSARYLGWSLMCVVGSSKSLYDIVHILLQLLANQLYYDARSPEFSCACRHFDSSGYRGWS